MAYVIERWECGDTIEVEKYHTFRHGGKTSKREDNHKPTPEQQQKINNRLAEKRLRRQMIANFTSEDLHVVLTFRPNERPTLEELRKGRYVQKFLGRMKKYYRRADKEMKYIYAVEYKATVIHIHLIITGTELSNIYAEWDRYGRVFATPLYKNQDYRGLAAYIIKETTKNLKNNEDPTGRRWVPSKNLVTPEAKKRVVKHSTWRKDPVPKKGYYIEKESFESGFHDATGYRFQRYVMKRLQGKPTKGG